MRTAILPSLLLGLVLVPANARSAEDSLERAAIKYRIQIYNTFRLDRDEYNLRRELGDRLLLQFEQTGQSKEAASELTAWFQASEAICRTTDGTLPTPPDLSLLVVETPAPAQVDTAAAVAADDRPSAVEEAGSDLAVETPADETPRSESLTDQPPVDGENDGNMLQTIGNSLWRAITQ